MEKSKILNRRFLSISSERINNFLEILEKIDSVIEESLNLEKVNSNCTVYGKDLKNFQIGREVVGNDPNLKHHEFICVEDFNEVECSIEHSQFSDKEELLAFLEKKMTNYTSYRFSFVTLDNVEFVFFNLEK